MPACRDRAAEVSTTAPTDWQFDYTNWQPRVSATYALGEKKKTLLRASYAQFADQLGFLGYYGSGVPISNGYYYYWTDANGDHIVQPRRDRLRRRRLRLLQRHRSGHAAEHPEPASTRTSRRRMTDEFTFGVDQQLTDDFAVSATFTYRNTKNLQQTPPTGPTSGPGSSPDDFVRQRDGNRPCRDAPTASRSTSTSRSTGSTLAGRAVGRHALATVPARPRSTTASTSRSSNDCRTTG